MTILFVGNTVSDFLGDSTSSSTYNNTDTTHRDPDYVPNDIAVDVEGDSSNPFGLDLGAEYTDVWVHYRYFTPYVDIGTVDGDFIRFFDSNNDEISRLDAQSDFFRAQARGDATQTGNGSPVPDQFSMTIDFHIELTGGNIVATLYHNGALASSATAANTGGKGGVQHVTFTNFDVTRGSRTTHFSEMIITNGEDTRGWRLACLEPNGTGNYSDFDGDYTKLADDDLATSAGTGTAGDRLSSTVSSYNGPATPAGIRAVVAKSVASRGDTGPTTAKQFLRIGTTDYDGSAVSLDTSLSGVMEVWDNNPDTGSGWDTADLTGIEIGIKAEA